MDDLARRIAELSPQQRALLEVQLLKKKGVPEPIALIGLGCRFPGAPSVAAFWELLCQGRDGITPVPRDRWLAEALYDADASAPGKTYCREGGFLSHVDQFDPAFFGIAPREAGFIDPQHRLFLEVAWEAIEDAALLPEHLSGTATGVFVGISTNDYGQWLLSDPAVVGTYTTTGLASTMVANRLSYLLNLRGPSLAIDTACSSSLVAVHLACQSLRSGECTIAIAGGVNLILRPELTIGFSKLTALSPAGRCKAFDAAADGFVRSEGAGAVVLKPLTRALQDGDPIYAVIRGSAVNQDGRSNGLTAPNREAQEKVITAAFAQAGLDPQAVDYIEAHGTGTLLGDPIEARALGNVLGTMPAGQRVAIGSVKSNIGHTEAAAGIASLIKTALCLKHRTLVPSLHFQTPNPHIPFDQIPLRVQSATEPWVPKGNKPLAAVSAFAFGGTNAHVVMQGLGDLEHTSSPALRPQQVFILSAKTPAALQAQMRQWVQWLPQQATVDLADLCHTLACGRTSFAHRVAIAASTPEAVVTQLTERLTAADELVARSPSSPFPVVFLFTGQGSQFVGMGRELYETQPDFRATVDHCAALLAPYLEVPLTTVLFELETHLHQTAYTQPALFVLEYALASLWQSWGIHPAAVLGHSVGEYVAACVAGILSLEDALKLIAQRGKLMQSLPTTGGMAAVFADRATVLHHLTAIGALAQTVTLATLNGPTNTVIAGSTEGITAVCDRCNAHGIRTQPLQVSHAFHSPLMDPILPVLGHLARQIPHQPPKIPIALNVTGAILSPGEPLDDDYWQQHARQPVRFADGLQALYDQGFRHFLEIGPRPVLSQLGRRCLPDPAVQWLSTLSPTQSDWTGLLSSLTRLYEQGMPVDWAAFDRPYPYRRLSGLPTYPFQRQRYWVEMPPSAAPRSVTMSSAQSPSTLSTDCPTDCLYEVVWEVAPLPAGAADAPLNQESRWLILQDCQGIGASLAEQVQSQGGRVVTVTPDHLSGMETEAFVRLLADLDWQDAPWQVVYLWGLDLNDLAGLDLVGAGLLSLVQALAQGRSHPSTRLWVVTQNTVNPTAGDPPPNPMAAPLRGLSSVIALELPELWGGWVDLAVGAEVPSTVHALIAHITAADGEDRAALRLGQRWGARLRPYALPAPRSAPSALSEGTYLITGGLGALGLRMAQSLVAQGAKTLVLMSRTADRPSDPSLAALQAAGITLDIRAVDVSDATAIAAAIADITATLPPLRGIVHAAGTLADGSLLHQTWADYQRVMAAKVKGAWHLHQATQSLPLDFFILISSAASLLGSPGQANYAAANAFLDALAHHRRALGLPAQTLNWGPWAETGLATQQADTVQRLSSRGIHSFSPAEGIQLWERLLWQGETLPPQLGVLQADWERLLTHLPGSRLPGYFQALQRTAVRPLAPDSLGQSPRINRDDLLTLPSSDRIQALQTYLQQQVAQVLGRSDTVSVTTNLLDLGLDSLMVMDLLGICKRDLGLTLYPREVFEHPTLESLSQYLSQELSRIFSATATSAPATAAPSLERPMPQPFEVPLWGRDRTFTPVAHKNPPAIFLLSSPRSGSTLLRVMLAGHPALFCPPELHLLPFDTLAERQTALKGSYLDQGLQRAMMELKGLDAEGCQQLLDTWVQQGMTVPETYQALQTLAGDRCLVDKSPTYGFSLSTLHRAEQVFDKARYIHLVRHPYAVIESFVRNRMDKLFDLTETADAYPLAMQTWIVSNANIQAFLATVDPQRHYFLRYEDLVTDPEGTMTRLCAFLELPFHPSVLTPYAQPEQRMTDGISAQSLPIDDPNFHQRQAIDATLADAWKTIRLPHPLPPEGETLAQQWGYPLPSPSTAAAAGETSLTLVDVPPLGTLQEQWVTVRGLDLCLCTWGDSRDRPLLCLHGILNQGAIWGAIAPTLAQQGFWVIAPDLRGHGKSAHLDASGNYQMLDHLADVDALIHQLGISQCAVVGHSMGAVLAAALASARPHIVTTLVMVEPVVPGEETDSAAEQLTTHLDYLAAPPTHPIYATWTEACDRFQASIPGLPRPWAEALTKRLLQSVDGGVQWRWDARLQVRTRFGLSGGTFTRDRYAQLLQHIQAPTTLLFGQNSDFNRPEDLTFQRTHLPHAQTVTLPGGHHLPLESPAALVQAIWRCLTTA